MKTGDLLVFLCCVSLRSAAPDLQKLNEDGELWLVNQGLTATIRCPPLQHEALASPQGGRSSFAPSLLHQPFRLLLTPEGQQLGWSCFLLLAPLTSLWSRTLWCY